MGPPTMRGVRETYERIAESFALTRRDPWPEVLEFIEGLPPGCRVLDLGCGNGRHARALIRSGRRAVGLDFSRRLLLLGRAAVEADWIEAEATALPLRSDTMDACVCAAVLHHLPSLLDRVRALREVRRVLRPGGSVFVSAWALDQPRFREGGVERTHVPVEPRPDVYVPWRLADGTNIPRYYHLFTPAELEEAIIESGLEGETFFMGHGNVFGRASKHG